MKKYLYCLVALVFVFASCEKKTIKGNGNVTEQVKALEAFNEVSIQGAFDVVLVDNDSSKLKIVADENLIGNVVATVEDSILKISNIKTVIGSRELKLYIYAPNIESVDFSGATELSSDSVLPWDALALNITGAGKVDLQIDVKKFSVNVSGGAEITLKGKTDELALNIAGTGSLNALALKTGQCDIDISGFGRAYVDVEKMLRVNISGFGKVEYNGTPEIRQNITGSAKIIKAGSDSKDK